MIKLKDAVWTPAGRFGEVIEFSKNGKQALVRYIGHGRCLADWIYVSTLKRSNIPDPIEEMARLYRD